MIPCRHRWRPMPPLPAKVCLACGAIASWKPLPTDSPMDVGPSDTARFDAEDDARIDDAWTQWRSWG